MKLAEFITMWEGDDLKMVEEERRIIDGATWILYSVTEVISTYDYGRHYALILVINKDEEVFSYNFLNIRSRDPQPWRPQVQDWWERHIAEGLFNEKGEPICV